MQPHDSEASEPEVSEPADAAAQESELGSEAEHAADIDQVLEAAIEQDQQTPVPETDAEAEVLKARAELENFRKRMQRDAELQLKYANMSLMRGLLEVVDNLQRAIAAASEEGSSIQALREGVELVSQQFVSVLEQHGCKAVEALGTEFDPNFHEAIAQMPSEEYAAGMVMQEVAIGYVLHDRVVRPSNVIVSTGPTSD